MVYSQKRYGMKPELGNLATGSRDVDAHGAVADGLHTQMLDMVIGKLSLCSGCWVAVVTRGHRREKRKKVG